MVKKSTIAGVVLIFGLVSGAMAVNGINIDWGGQMISIPAGTANGTLYDFDSGFTMVSQLDPAVYGELLLTPTWLISFQGKLENMEDQQLNLTFRIFDAKTGGSKLWEDTYSVQTDGNGIFNVLLGSGTEKLTSVDFRKPVWLEVRVGTATLSPRQSLTSAPSALVARSVYGAYSSVPAIVYADNQAPAQGVGVMGKGASAGGSFQSTNGYGVFAKTDATDRGAVYGEGGYAGLAGNTVSESGSYGVRGSAPGTSTGVFGTSYHGAGVEGYATGSGGIGVKGAVGSNAGTGVWASSNPAADALYIGPGKFKIDSDRLTAFVGEGRFEINKISGTINLTPRLYQSNNIIVEDSYVTSNSMIFLTVKVISGAPAYAYVTDQKGGEFRLNLSRNLSGSDQLEVNFLITERPFVFAPIF